MSTCVLGLNDIASLPFVDQLRVSDVAIADPFFAVLQSIRQKSAAVRRRWSRMDSSTKSKSCDNYAHKAGAALRFLENLESRLDTHSLITHTSEQDTSSSEEKDLLRHIRREVKNLGKTEDYLAKIFGFRVGKTERDALPVHLENLLEDLKLAGNKARAFELSFRLTDEITERAAEGWYIVFQTLTVDQEGYPHVFSQGSQAWRNYIQTVDRIIGAHVHGSVRKAAKAKADSPYHSYFAVVERGGLHGRHHIHVIHCFRDIPDSWKRDPNHGRAVAHKREIVGLKGFWKHGWAIPIACRFGIDDAFSQLGWIWPVKRDGKVFKPIERKPALALARYVTKYIHKSYGSDKGDYQWRTRLSRGCGLSKLRATIAQNTPDDLMYWLANVNGSLTIGERKLPRRLVRIEMLRYLLKQRRNAFVENDPNGWRKSTLRKSLTLLLPQPPIVEQWRYLMMGRPLHNSRSSSTMLTPTLNAMAVSDVVGVFERCYSGDTRRILR